VNNTYFRLLAEFGEANIPLAKVAPKYFGLSFEEARRRAPTQLLPCRVFRLGGQKSPWLVSATDLAELIDRRRDLAGKPAAPRPGSGGGNHSALPAP
jgi:pyocin activator protein PrtN